MTIGQHLSEEEVVVGPDGIELTLVGSIAFIIALGDVTAGNAVLI